MLWKVWCLNLVWWQCQWHVWWQCQWHVCRHNCWHSAGRLVPVNRRHYYTRLCQVMSCPSWRTFIIKQISNSYEQRGSEDWVLPRSRFILDIHNKVTITDLIHKTFARIRLYQWWRVSLCSFLMMSKNMMFKSDIQWLLQSGCISWDSTMTKSSAE